MLTEFNLLLFFHALWFCSNLLGWCVSQTSLRKQADSWEKQY